MFYSETLIPFPLVKNDLPTSAQVTRTPYYRLVRTQFWKKPGVFGSQDEQTDQIYIPGEVRERTVRVKTGMKISESEETFKKLNVGFTSSQEIGGPIGKLTAKVTRSLSLGLELSQKNTLTKEETYEREESLKTTFEVRETMRVIHYIKVDRYRLFRLDGTEISRWDVNTNVKHLATFPEAKVEGRPGGRIFSIKPKPSIDPNNICWTDLVGVKATGNSLTKTNTTSWWNSGAASTGKLPAGQDGWVEMIVSETNTYRMFGLSATNENAAWNTIEHNFYLMVGGKIKIYEKGVFKTNGGTYKVGDKIRVERARDKILYKKNDTIIYTSITNPNVSLLADVSMYTTNGTITNARSSFSCSSRIVEVTSEEKSNEKKVIDVLKNIIKVFPNPSHTGIYTINLSKEIKAYDIKVYNSKGSIVYSNNYKNKLIENIPLDLSPFPKGIYFFKLNINNKIITKRLIKN